MNKLIFFLIVVVLCPIFATAQMPKFTVATEPWNADQLGNIRAVVKVTDASKTVFTRIEWRRRDQNPVEKNIIVTAADGTTITNVTRGSINREFGEIYFEATCGPGTYYVYYLPYKKSGSANYPKDFYPKFEETADIAWAEKARTIKTANAQAGEIQSIDAFNSFYPMEVIATAADTQKLLQQNVDKAFLLFPEDRLFPIKMSQDLPQRWIERGLTNTFSGSSRRGEFYAFQLGLVARKDLNNVKIAFTDMKSGRATIPAKDMTCINVEGVDFRGNHFDKVLDVKTSMIQPLWCGIDTLVNTVPGEYMGSVSVSADGEQSQTIALKLVVLNELAPNGGFNEPEKMTRLKWLNSTMAQENTIISPYTPVVVKGNELSLLGRKITLGRDGLPTAIRTFFTPEMTTIGAKANDIITNPMSFRFTELGGATLTGTSKGTIVTLKTPGKVSWQASTIFEKLKMDVSGSLEFDGFASYTVKITATDNVDLDDIRLTIPYDDAAAKYLMGLGEKGRTTPPNLKWKWDVKTKNQDGAWLGGVNAGMQFSLRDENYVRPLNTNFYLQKPLLLPTSWGNNGNGGIDITRRAKSTDVESYSGARSMKKGDTLYYNFTLLITPFHTIDTDWQWQTRFYHRYSSVDEAKASGATVINLHHANAVNPYINYPFIAHKEMKAYIDEAHQKGLTVKIYNTVRELSNRAYELPALRSLGHEIFSPGNGGGFPWLQEHVGDDYIAAWFVPDLKDAAIVNSGVSRWHNYYVEGMNWLTQNVGIDGIYLDDVAFDRVTMKRIKRVLTRNAHPGIIDLHSANQFNKNDGFNNSAMLYLEHFPYLNRLWFGEYFDYENNSPDFFLTEVSGIPFGLMGEMLEKGGNPWRGMIYGMTNRMPWSDNADPRPIWKAWDDFGMKGTAMIGYWSPNCPVKTSNPNVLATVYKKKSGAMVSIASWAEADTTVELSIDWKSLGINPKTATIDAPEIKGFQTAQKFNLGEKLQIPKNKGVILIVR